MSIKRAKGKEKRKPHQRKPVIKGRKSCRGCPELYDEPKKPTSLGLTQTAINGLDEMSAEMNISRSELVERIGRKLLEIKPSELLALTQEVEA